MPIGTAIAQRPGLPSGLRVLAAGQALAARSAEKLKHRRRVLSFALAPSASQTPAAGNAGPIWQFWAQGADAAPPLIRNCLASVARFKGDRELIVLDAQSCARYADLPPVVIEKREEMGWTKFANALRLALLHQHGGTWMDATLFQSAAMPAEVAGARLVLPGPGRPSHLSGTWFIQARAGDPLLVAWIAALTRYWQADLPKRPYFHLHYLLEALVTLDAGLERHFASALLMRARSDGFPSRLGDALHRGELKTILESSWVHKLSHKIPIDPAALGPTFLDHFSALDG